MNRVLQRKEKDLFKAVSELLANEVKDQEASSVVITRVSLTNDMSVVSIFVDTLTPKQTLALKRAKGFIQVELFKRLGLRKQIEVKFKKDLELVYQSRIEELLKKANE